METRYDQEHSVSGDWDAGSKENRNYAKELVAAKSKPRQRLQYPLGISLGVVSNAGNAPECTGCKQLMKRGSQRVLLTTIENDARSWKKTTSFHLEEDCIRAMDWMYQDEARSLISSLAVPSDQPHNHNVRKPAKKRSSRKSVLRELSSSLGPAWTHSTPSRKRC